MCIFYALWSFLFHLIMVRPACQFQKFNVALEPKSLPTPALDCYYFQEKIPVCPW